MCNRREFQLRTLFATKSSEVPFSTVSSEDPNASDGACRLVIVTPAERIQNAQLLTGAFKLRHRVFVDVRGWEELRSADSLDADRHDDGAATHILLTKGSIVRGHGRIIPGGYLHATRADPQEVQRLNLSPRVFGLSRFCYDPDLPDVDQRAGVARLFGAAVEYAIKMRISHFIFDTDPVIILFLRVLGFSVVHIGSSVRHHGRLMQPVALNVDHSVLPIFFARLAAWEHQGFVSPLLSR
jgi:acyl-homoserine lactone synthase